MTPAEEAGLASTIVKRARDKWPMAWSTIGEAAMQAVDNRWSGPVGRARIKSGPAQLRSIANGKTGPAWKRAFCGRNDIKNFKPEDIGHSRARPCNEHNKNAYFAEHNKNA
jgi:hypothetical protein